ncbi:MAG: hypothetical protein DWQ37_10300 [Planctomycetota bacterium]|nr:MAG: hypothetical protein DWQ37_10300 [Planctomycetota bacterium]
MAKRRVSLHDQLRQRIADSGVTLYRIAKDSDVKYAVLHRFVNRTAGMSLDSADKLAAYFGLRFCKDLNTKKKGG